jgi:hypothetical protein
MRSWSALAFRTSALYEPAERYVDIAEELGFGSGKRFGVWASGWQQVCICKDVASVAVTSGMRNLSNRAFRRQTFQPAHLVGSALLFSSQVINWINAGVAKTSGYLIYPQCWANLPQCSGRVPSLKFQM